MIEKLNSGMTEEEFLKYYKETRLGVEERTPNLSSYSESLDEEESEILLTKSKSKTDSEKTDFLIDKDEDEDGFGGIDEEDETFKNIFDIINNDMYIEGIRLNDIGIHNTADANSKDVEDKCLHDSELSEMIEKQNSDKDELPSEKEINKFLTENNIVNNESTSLTEVSQENKVSDKNITEDIENSLENIINEIESFNPKFKGIVEYNIKSISTIVQNYLNNSVNTSVQTSSYNMTLKDLVKSPFNNIDMIKLTKVMNIRENIRIFSQESQKLIDKLQEDFSRLREENLIKRNEIIKQIEDFKLNQVNELNNLYDGESKLLTMKEDKFRERLKEVTPMAVNSALTEHKDLFDDIELLKSEIEDIKAEIVGVLGKNFISVKEHKIIIPRNKEELQELISDVTEQLNDLEIKDSSFYKRTITKLMKIIFAPTRHTEGSARSIVLLINLLAFLFVAVKFRDILVLIFTSTILIDLYNQIKLSNTNKDTDLVMEFALRSDEIIQVMTNEIINKQTTKIERKVEPILNSLTEKFSRLREELDELFNEKLAEIDDSFDEDVEIEKVKKKYERIESAITTKLNKAMSKLNSNIKETEYELERLLNSAIEEAKAIPNIDIYREGNDGSVVYNPTYKVGRLTICDGQLGMDITRQFVEGSYLIQVNSREDKDEALEKVKLLAIQQLTHLKPEHFKINFIDLEELGNEFMDMLSEEEGLTQAILTEEDLENFLKESFKEIEVRYKTATKDFNSVSEYNEKCAELKQMPFKYRLNIFFNFKNDLFRKQQFRTLLTEGSKAGIINVVIFDLNDLYDFRGEKDKELERSFDYFDFFIRKTNDKWTAEYGNSDEIVRGSILPSVVNFEREPLEFNRTGIMHKMRNLEEHLEESRQDIVLYEELERKYAPELFKKDTLTGIELCVGFRDGNLDKPEYVKLGDELVHALMGGKTGAGKSNTINVILMNLIRSYSPEWLELYMVDFKNVEFNFYTEEIRKKSFTKKLSKIPHTALIAGTTDAQYALSVFNKALTEMERRKKILSKGIEHNGEIVTFKKIESYNRFVLKHNLKQQYPILPRILILLDEFQVMFQIEDQNILSMIKSMITRLSKEARSMGIHMFFTSQSMEGTLPDDVKGQFAMRWCLSATVETSKGLIGNDAASKLKGKGFIIMNGSMERKEEDNQLYKVPFIPEEYITEKLEEIRKEALRLHEENPNIPYHRQEFYDELDAHKHTELKAYLEVPTIKQSSNSVLLGPKVIFKDKSTPENFSLGNSDGDNIVVMGNDRVSLANLINTLTENFASKERTRIVIANYDKNLEGLINMEHHAEYMNEFMEPNNALPLIETLLEQFVPSDVSPAMSEAERKMAEIFGGAGEEDEEKPYIEPFDPKKHDRYYVFLLGINKAEGFNEDYVDDKYMAPLVNLLKYGPTNGITTILNYKPPFRLNRLLPQISHRISAKVTEDVSFDLFGGRKASSLVDNDKTSFGIYKSTVDDREFRFKIYQFDYDKKLLKPKELDDVIIA